jgi:hypothetical protein
MAGLAGHDLMGGGCLVACRSAIKRARPDDDAAAGVLPAAASCGAQAGVPRVKRQLRAQQVRVVAPAGVGAYGRAARRCVPSGAARECERAVRGFASRVLVHARADAPARACSRADDGYHGLAAARGLRWPAGARPDEKRTRVACFLACSRYICVKTRTRKGPLALTHALSLSRALA